MIEGVTLYLATGIDFKSNSEAERRMPEEKLRWKRKVVLVIDKISQVIDLTLASVDSQLRWYRDDVQQPFCGIPIVIFFGDFGQLNAVQQTSLLLPRSQRYIERSEPDSVAKHPTAHELFLQFPSVMMLNRYGPAAAPRRAERA